MPDPSGGLLRGRLDGVLTGALARARAQAGLLATATALLLLATTLTATSAHLLTGGQDAALAVALAAAPARETTALARLALAGGTTGAEQQQVLDDAADVLASGTSPAPAQRSTTWTSSARYLDPAGGPAVGAGDRDLDSGTLAALGSFDATGGLALHADLVSGRWPDAPGGSDPESGTSLEVAVPDAATGVLPLGATAVLTPAPADESATAPLTAVVVGTYRPRSGDPLWRLDPLRGAGTTTAAGVPGTRGRVQRPAVGPLLVDPAALAAPGAPAALTAATGGAVVVPDLGDLTPRRAHDLLAGAARAPAPSAAVRDALGERVTAASTSAALPGLLVSAAAQQRTAGAGLLVAAVAGAGAALVALAALAQLLAARRRDESVLLAVRGASPRQQLARDAAELLPLVAVAVALAVPLSALAAGGLLGAVIGAGTPPPGGLAGGGTALAAAAATGTVAAVVVLLVLARGRAAGVGGAAGAPGRATRAPVRGPLARSGADVLLLAVAAAAAWQLRSDGSAAGSSATTGAALVAAPALALLASALLGLRVLGLLRRVGERTARRSPGVARAVTGWALARGPLAGATAALVVLSAATTTTALAWRAAWTASTAQQVAAAQGADVVVQTALSSDDGPGDGPGGGAGGGVGALRTSAALAAATGLAPSPVAVLRVALGTRSAAGPVSLVSAPADGARGLPAAQQLDGEALTGPALPTGPVRLAVSGRGALDGGLTTRVQLPELQVVPSLLVRDPRGVLAVLDGTPVVLDGVAHDVALPDPGATGSLQVVGAWLRVLPSADADPDDPLAVVEQRLEVRLDLPGAQAPTGAAAGAAAGWSTTTGGDGAEGALSSTSAQVEPSGAGGSASGGPAVVVSALVRPAGLPQTGAVVRAQSLPAPEALPVLVSPELADQVGARTGQQVAVVVGQLQVVARVVGVVPAVPAAPGEPALLADADALDAALLAGGSVPAPDRWWLSAPSSAPSSSASGSPGGPLDAERQRAAVAAVESAGLGTATGLVRATADAQDAPLAAALRAGWALLLVTAAAAALAGPALQVAAAAPDDARTSARLAVLGVRRRERLRVVVAPRALQLLLALLVGGLAGLVVAAAVVPALVRAPDGGLPVPGADAALVLRAALTGAPLLLAAGALGVLLVLVAVPLLVSGVTGVVAARRGGGS